MKKVFKSRIFIICGIIFTSLGVYAGTTYPYQASDVAYTPSDGSGETINVNDALNEIYNIKQLGDATEEDILEGKTAVVQGKLITGTGTSNEKLLDNVTHYSTNVLGTDNYSKKLIETISLLNSNVMYMTLSSINNNGCASSWLLETDGNVEYIKNINKIAIQSKVNWEYKMAKVTNATYVNVKASSYGTAGVMLYNYIIL